VAARRVLVPLAVVVLAAALWFWPAPGEGPVVDVPSDVNECAANLRHVYAALLRYGGSEKRVPAESGVRFLAALIASGALEDAPESRARLTCPGPRAEPVRAGADYRAPAGLTAADSAYAARDALAHPLAKFPAGGAELEALVACDNARGLNHEGCMNVLYSDGSVRTLLLAQEIERGHLPAGATTISVGKDSPIPDLRKLSTE
jgi:hypothetical protein